MKAILAVGTLAVLCVSGDAWARDIVEIGWFRNEGVGQISYQGEFEKFVNASAVGNETLIDIHLSALLASVDAEAFVSIQVIDTGANQYNQKARGADIDLFSFTGLSDDVEVSWVYEGDSAWHNAETSDELGVRVAAIDAVTGDHEGNSTHFVSLDYEGMLSAILSNPQGIIPGSGGPATGGNEPVLLHLTEAGVGESFIVNAVTTTVPAPGAMALLGLAGLASARRRRDAETR